jgi:hypothetical protein
MAKPVFGARAADSPRRVVRPCGHCIAVPSRIVNRKSARRQDPEAAVVVCVIQTLILVPLDMVSAGCRDSRSAGFASQDRPLREAPYAPYCDIPQPRPQPAPRMVKLPDLGATSESALAGIAVSAADAPITVRASDVPRSDLINLGTRILPGVGEGDMAVRSWGCGHSLQQPQAIRKRQKLIHVTNVISVSDQNNNHVLGVERDFSALFSRGVAGVDHHRASQALLAAMV